MDEEQKEYEEQTLKTFESCKLKYKDVQTIIQKQFKRLTQKQEIEKTSFLISTEENNSILKKINEQQRINDSLQLEYERSSTQVNQAQEEVARMQQIVSNANEIDQQLNGYFNKLRNKNKILNDIHQEEFNKLFDQKEEIKTVIETKNSHLDKLKKTLADIRNTKETVQDDGENALFKQEIVMRRDYLDKLKQNFELTEQSCISLGDEKTRLQKDLLEKKDNIVELDKKINIVENNTDLTVLNDTLENKTQRIKALEQNTLDVDTKIAESKVKIEEVQKIIETKSQLQVDNEIKLTELEKDIKEKESKLAEISENNSTKINIIKADIDTLEQKLRDLRTENYNKVQALMLLKNEYIEKIKEKNTLNQNQGILEQQLLSKNVQNELLDEKISTKKTEIKRVEEDLERIDDHPSLQTLKKKKAVLVACENYLREEDEKLRNEYIEAKRYFDNITKDVNSLTKEIESKDKNKDLAGPRSILKKNLPLNPPVSPKSVQFARSSSSSSISHDKVSDFDKLLESFIRMKGHQPEQPVSKKRKLFFD